VYRGPQKLVAKLYQKVLAFAKKTCHNNNQMSFDFTKIKDKLGGKKAVGGGGR
jgi:hypothetical protein